MPINPIEGTGFQLLQMALDAAGLRQQAIASNIANAGTAGYQPLRVSFEDRLQSELSSMPSSHPLSEAALNRLRPEIETDTTATSGVALDQQMALLSQNNVQYQALLKLLNGKFELASMAINDGRK